MTDQNNSVKVYDLRTVTMAHCLEFDHATVPDYAVAYAYCEENNRMSWLFEHVHSKTMDLAYKELPMMRAKTLVACGDFVTRLKTD